VGSQLNSLNFHRILLIGQHKLDSRELLYQQQNYDSSSQRSTYHWLQRLWKLDIWLPMQTPMVHMQSQWLPEDYEDKLLEFQRFIIKNFKIHNFELSQISNADQTPITFDFPSSITIATSGSKSVTSQLGMRKTDSLLCWAVLQETTTIHQLQEKDHLKKTSQMVSLYGSKPMVGWMRG